MLLVPPSFLSPSNNRVMLAKITLVGEKHLVFFDLKYCVKQNKYVGSYVINK